MRGSPLRVPSPRAPPSTTLECHAGLERLGEGLWMSGGFRQQGCATQCQEGTCAVARDSLPTPLLGVLPAVCTAATREPLVLRGANSRSEVAGALQLPPGTT
eukprot:CAMPEP_0194497720 /NCGR_PEP_ID=MMETSP0253-20130528/14575_1 /TAXON_ID=2966 /ORGANISM="Noctiluca scintillans" /LENGTH=101 /DNA_ID=CAMNT_0039339255 /DNA_START=616 /DNA_END=922 /DNA_ORIENTATION=+